MNARIDVETFRGRVARGQPLADAVTRLAPDASPKPATDGSRRITFTYSDESVDRDYDKVFASGWQLDAYRKNPVAIFGHDSKKPENVIGKSTNLRVEGGRLIGDIEFAPASINANAEMVYQLYKGGFLNAVSVGFRPIDYKLTDDETRPGGIDFLRQELMEISAVPIPANSNALAIARSKGLDLRPLGLSSSRAKTPGRRGLATQMLQVIERHGQAARTLNAIALVPSRRSTSKSLPAVPQHRVCHPTLMLRDEISRDFDSLWRWSKAADAAGGSYSAQQRQLRAEVQKRVDLLRGFVWC